MVRATRLCRVVQSGVMESEQVVMAGATAAEPAETPPVPYLADLNPAQRAAVEAVDGPVLVLAGAGTGKTRVLTTRLAHILRSRRAQPWEVLAVTFTNKAARQMRERVAAMVGGASESIWLGTFHALGARILRRHAEVVGLRSNFTILDADDQLRLLKQVLQGHEIDDRKWPARVLMGVIQRWKDRGLTPDRITPVEAGDLAGGRLATLYADYQERLAALNAADFGDLLLHCLTLFAEQADVLAQYQERFRYLLVDEYQDTNVAQYLWLRLLAQRHRNIACVGDDDQSIYAWRGAEVGNILRFERDFAGASVVRLEQNYRSTQHILGAASGLIGHNDGRLGKTLWTSVEGGERVTIRGVWDSEQEARSVSDTIEKLQRRGTTALQDMAILVRASFQTREFEDRFLTLGIPYRVVGGPRFYERQEIRDAMAYLRVIQQPDDDLAFERIVNKPKRGIGNATLQTLHRAARAADTSLYRATGQLIGTDELKPRVRTALTGLITDFERWRAMLEAIPHPEVAETVLEECGYTDMLRSDKSPEAPGRLENLKELITAIAEFENLTGFLEHVALVMENTETAGADMVSIMTLHGAKGLEFDTVFLPGWEEGLFPHQRNLDENGPAGLEEERRLAYVGLTRAKRHAYVLFAASRRLRGRGQGTIVSRFVEELPADHVEVVSEPGLFGNLEGRVAGRLTYAAEQSLRPGRTFARRPEPLLIEGEAQLIINSGPTDHRPGARVFHQKFGYGQVVAVDDNKLEIAFDKAGMKKVIGSFVVAADAL